MHGVIARKPPERRLWQMKRGGFEEVSRFSRRASGWKPADTTVKAKRRLWRMKRGGFEEVSRFSRHNVAGNRLTRRCVLLPTFPAGGKSGPPEAVPYIKSSKEKIVLAFCRRGIYNRVKSIKGQSVRRLVRRRRNRVRSPASWSL